MMTPSTTSPSMTMSLAYPTGSLREEFRSHRGPTGKLFERRIVCSSPAPGTGPVTGASRLGAREVDVAALDVGADELDLHVVADVEALDAAHQPPLDGRSEDADPRALLRGAGHERVEPLADSRGEQQRGGGLPDL